MKIPELKENETYVGCVGDKDGNINHVILLPSDKYGRNWQYAMDWAASIGGDLPNRIEQAMLFDGFRDQFQKDWYWSNTTVDGRGDAYAWCQGFNNGGQISDIKIDNYRRARAVRRVKVEHMK